MAKKKSVKKAYSRKVDTTSENKYLPTLLIILVSILILMGLLMWRNKMRDQKYGEVQKQISQSSEPTQNYQLDTENDGVYTNSQYGFTFKYPKEVFVSYEPINIPNSTTVAIFHDRIQDLGDFQMTISASNNKDEVSSINKYRNMKVNMFEYSDQELKSLKLQNKEPFNTNQKLRNLDSKYYKGVLLYSKYTCQLCETEPSNGHSARLILNNGTIVSISIFSPANMDATFSDSFKNQRLDIITKLVQSLEII